MNAKELHRLMVAGRVVLADPTTGHPHMPTDQEIAHRALSLLAAAEANDGTTPETDALVRFEFESTEQPFPAHALLAMIQMAKRLERERNRLAHAHADALEENARLKERVALDDTEREYRRQSLANEIRETLKVRGHSAAARPSDLIGCVARAIESERDRANLAEAELAALREQLAEREAELAALKGHAEKMAAEVRRLCNLPRESFTKHLNLSYDQRAYSWHEIQYLLGQWESEQRLALKGLD